MDELYRDEEPKKSPYWGRLQLLRLAVFLVFLLLSTRLWQIQIAAGPVYKSYADENRFRVSTVQALRGVIYDRNGQQLVHNVPSFTVAIVPAGLPRGEEAIVFQRLGALLGLEAAEVESRFNESRSGSSTPAPIATNIPFELVATLEEYSREMPGVQVIVEPRREYPTGALTSHLLGYVGRITREQYRGLSYDAEKNYNINDFVGQTGLELQYERELRGTPGEELLEVDSTERPVRILKPAQSQPGLSLVLTIDLNLQKAISDILSRDIAKYGSTVAIAIDPRNGQILAMVDLPTYDNNLFSQGIPDDKLANLMTDPSFPLVNRVIGGGWEPGSTFKIVTAAAALQEGVVTPSTIINDPGGIWVPNEYIKGAGIWLKNWTVHGRQDMVAALANSCDTYFYLLAGGDPEGKWDGLGNKRLANYARLFGFGSLTGIDLPGEIPGLVPDEGWKKAALGEPWVKGDTYTYGIGQSYLMVTPLQMLNATIAIANGGKLLRPQLVLEIRDKDGRLVRPFQPQVIRELPIDKRYIQVIKQGLRANVSSYGVTPNGATYVGTAWTANIPELELSGKTGTAEYGTPGPDGKYPTHGWFTAYAPMDNPEIALLVFVEKGRGPQDAAEIAEQILRQYYNFAGGAKSL